MKTKYNKIISTLSISLTSTTVLFKKNLKFFILLTFSIMTSIIGVLAYNLKHVTIENIAIKNQNAILDKVNDNLQSMEPLDIVTNFAEIDSVIDITNKLLSKKGLSKVSIKDLKVKQYLASNEIEVDQTKNNLIDQLAEFRKQIEYYPLGYPYNGDITSTFGNRNNPFGGGVIQSHSGIDFRGNIGDAIFSTASGTVSFAGWKGGYGNCVIVDHNNGLKTLYAHMSKISVKENQTVTTGEKVGELGNTGRSTGPHLHYEVHVNDRKVDPKNYL